MRHNNTQLSNTKTPAAEYCPEMISQLLGDAELKDKMAQTTSSKNWLKLIKIVAKLVIDNTELKMSLYNLQMQYLNHDLHLEAVEAKADRALRQCALTPVVLRHPGQKGCFMQKDLFSENDRQLLKDCFDTIDSGLIRISSSDYGDRELCEAVRFAGERVENGFCILANSLDRLSRCFEEE